jgi:thiamine biosynthesis lipoprotein
VALARLGAAIVTAAAQGGERAVNEQRRPPGSASRRRFLKIAGAAAASAALTARSAPARSIRHVRNDVLLGAETQIQLYHPDAQAAHAAIAQCLDEVRRLEAIFTLEQPASALSQLNRDGRLAEPPAELVTLLEKAAGFSRATSGAFDVTVQPLWELFARHFADNRADVNGPAAGEIESALSRVGYQQVQVSPRRIVLGRHGAAITLNGIAQGYITDRIAEMLRAQGFEHVLVNMGEMRALRGHADGTPWRIGIADPDRPWHSFLALPLVGRAIATSGGYGTPFDASGRHHHLFDPRRGDSANYYRSVSVLAPDATTADALSTGLSALPPKAALAVLDAYPDVGALFLRNEGGVMKTGAVAARSPGRREALAGSGAFGSNAAKGP